MIKLKNLIYIIIKKKNKIRVLKYANCKIWKKLYCK